MNADEVCRTLDCDQESLAWAMDLGRKVLLNAPADLLPLGVAVRLRHHLAPETVLEVMTMLIGFAGTGAKMDPILLVDSVGGWAITTRAEATNALWASDGHLSLVIDLQGLQARVLWNLDQLGKDAISAAPAD